MLTEPVEVPFVAQGDGPPVLLLHGANDESVPTSQSTDFARRYSEAGARVEFHIIPGAPHEVLLVMDATTGQNGLQQARQFTESAGVTGIVLTKLDGTAKGGVVVAISRELGLPVRYVGVGEKAADLLPFDPKEFVDSLFS